jgi:hypothetical protein
MIEMATWTENMDEYVGKLLGHLARHAPRWRKREPIRHRQGAFRASTISAGPVGALPVVEVDPELASAWQSRFAELRRRIEEKDNEGARKLLSTRPT